MDFSSFLLRSDEAKQLYSKAKDYSIVDYHCHLSPKEIYEDKPFDNIGEMWLSGDHYKWRIMRNAGIDERYITGDASWEEKFEKYAEAISMAAGNPVYHWTAMELYMYFGISEPLNKESAKRIWKAANEKIKSERLSPRKLISDSKVEYIATTDDMTDSLEFHRLIKEDKSFRTTVAPSFRTDRMLLICQEGYPEYIKKLEEVSGVKIDGIDSLCHAIVKRLDFFCENGCKFTDVGIAYFPDREGDIASAEKAFRAAIAGEPVDSGDYMSFIAYMYTFLGKEYKKRNLVMQLHLAVYRNASSRLYALCGADSGGDCINDEISCKDIVRVLDSIDKDGGLPKTIIYTLNPAMAFKLASIAASFRNVYCGAAWWFCDHKRGIEEQIRTIAESGTLSAFFGMLTDSRSFLSYARHDYFRRILCSVIGDYIKGGEFDPLLADELVLKICNINIKNLISEK